MIRALPSPAISLPTGRLFALSAANVVELAAREPEGLRFARVGKAERRLQFEKLFMEIETANVERQLGLQHLKEASDMLGALGEGVGREPQATVPQLRHGSRAGLVPRSEIKVKAHGTLLEQAFVGAAEHSRRP